MKKCMKRFISLLIAVVVLISGMMIMATPVYAYEYKYKDVIYRSSELYLNTYVVAGSDWDISGDVEILSDTAGCPVIRIEPGAFWSRTGITSISIPNRITSIGSGAFGSCIGLSSVTLPASLTSIDSEVFWGCTGLTTITIPEYVTKIGTDAFYGCSNLQTVYFKGTSSQWENVSISSGNDALKNARIVFWGELPGSDPDLETKELRSIQLDVSSVKTQYEVGEQLDISGLIVTAVYEDYSTERITEGYSASGFDSSITGTQWVSITYKGKTASYMITVSSPTVVTPGISIKTLPTKTKYGVGEDLDTAGLTLIMTYSDGRTAEIFNGYSIVSSFDSSYAGEQTVIVSYAGYTTSFKVYVVIEGMIANGVCGSDLTWVLDDQGILTISGTGDMIDYGYFGNEYAPWDDYKSRVKKVVINSGVTSIGSEAFSSCSSLTEILLPEGLLCIGSRAFTSCSSLVSVVIPETVTSIGSEAFTYCRKLASVILPSRITSIGYRTFTGCTSLTTITIPDGVTNIAGYAFAGCSNLVSVTIPTSVTSIEEYAFASCSNLNDIYYKCTQEKWDKITIGANNETLVNATLHITPASIIGVSISSAPKKVEYWVGDALDTTGLKLTAIYNDDTIIDVTTGFSISGFDSSAAGSKTIIISYEGFEVTYSVLVRDILVYSIVYDANGGVGAPDIETKEFGKSITLSSIIPTKEGSAFLGWATTADGEVVYVPGAEYSNDADIILYAVWHCHVYDNNCDINCNDCGETRNVVHIYGDWVIIEQPTYTESGSKYKECIVCGDQIVEGISATGKHNYVASITVPTCTERGYTTHICSVCGDSYVDSYVEADGHDYVIVVTDPTCIAQGYTTHTCDACGDSYVDAYISAKGHKYTDDCDTTCNNCDYVREITHKYSNWIVTKEPTCVDSGSKYQECNICGDMVTETISATGEHQYDVVVTNPTCVEYGYTTHTCCVCADQYVDTYVQAFGHKYDGACDTDCSVCGAEREISHNYGAWINVDEDNHKRTCQCGHAEFAVHNWDKGIVTIEPTNSTYGELTYTCEACLAVKVEQIDKTTIVATGICGDDLTWALYDTGVLSIDGTGAMYEWSNFGQTPWWSYIAQIKSIVVGEGCTTIGSYAFAMLSGITPYDEISSVTLPSTLERINYRAFYLCRSITEVNISVNNIVAIDDYAFYGCAELQEFTFGENLKRIGNDAFESCVSLNSFVLNSKLESVGRYAFFGCDSVEFIEIQENLESIGLGAFSACDSLQRITVHPDNPYFASDDSGVLYDPANHILIQYPTGNTNSSYVIDNTITEIARDAFSNCYNLKEVYLPKSLSTIGSYNFGTVQQQQVLYYAGTSAEWKENVTASTSYTVLFNNGAAEYKVTYDSNGAGYQVGTNLTQIKVHDVDLQLETDLFTKSGYKLKGWSTTTTGQVEYSLGGIYSDNAEITLYAVWEPRTYIVKYDANGGVGAPEEQKKTNDVTLVLSSIVPTNTGYIFQGWATSANGSVKYYPGDHYTANTGVTLYAIWSEPHKYNIVFDANGGEGAPESQIKTQEQTLILPDKTPTRYGYTFLYWSPSAVGGNLSVAGFESAHNYLNSTDETWVISCPGATSITLTFDSRTAFESNYDYLYIYDSSKTLVSYYTGNSLSSKTIVVSGDMITLRLVSDYSTTKWGFAVTSAVAEIATYAPGSEYTTDSDIRLYAIWKACEHNWNSGEVTIEPTHTTFGEREYICQDCLATKTEQIAKTTAHSYGSWTKVNDETHQRTCACGDVETEAHNWDGGTIIKQPTCTVAGVKTYTCSTCKHSYTESIAALGHDWEDATCTTPKTCATCGTTSGSALGHSYTSKVTKQPTCTAAGVRTYTCSTCKHTYTESIAALGHSWSDATCTAPKICSTCGTTSGNALGHNYTSKVTKQSTCTATGVKTYTCSTCKHTYTESIAALGHTWSDATCTAPKTCSTCGTTSGSALGHSYTSKVTKAPTCTATGVKTHTCSVCSHSYPESIAALGHSWNTATCTAPKTCSVCGATSGSALGHNYTSKVTKQPTCTATGVKTYTCSACNHSYTESIAALGHDWEEATCTAPNTCSACGTTSGNALGHNYTSKVTKHPTCTVTGVKTYTCSTCKHSYTESIAALGHTWSDATCTAPKTCSACDATSGSALGHNYKVRTTEYPTCTESGIKTYACTNCEDSYTEEIPALGHNFDAGKVTKKATCKDEGVKIYTCEDCGDTKAEAIKKSTIHDYTDATCTAPRICKVCSSKDGEALGHAYDSDCDVDCNVCGATREVGDHLWVEGVCSVCGEASPSKVTIIKEPKTGYAKLGAKATVRVTAEGEGLTYEWYIKNSGSKKYSKSSVTKASYSTILNAKSKDRLVFCRVYDQYGNMVQTKTVRLREAVSLAEQPTKSAIYAQNGKKASVKVTASGDGLTYTWYIKNDGASKYSKSSVTSATYSATMGSKVKGRRVYCVVTDKYGKTVQSKTFILRESVSITTQPKTVTVAKNKTAKATVKASGDGLKYAWYIKNEGSSKYSKSSVTSATYSTKMIAASKNRLVYCVVTDKYGNTVKTVTVKLKMK